MIKLFKYMNKKDLWLIFGSLIFVVAQVYLDLKMPEYMSQITILTQTPGSEMSDILTQGSYMLLCSLGSLVAAIVVGYFAARIAASFGGRLRQVTFDKVEDFSLNEMNQFSTPSLITRSTNDITQVQMVVAMGLQVMIKAPILAVWGITKIAGKSWQWTAATGVAILLLVTVLAVIMIFAVPKFKLMQTLTDNVSKVMRENLTGIRVIRAYNAEEFREDVFNEANTELTMTQLFTSRLMAIMSPFMTVIMSGLSLSIYWIGAIIINNTTGIESRVYLFSDMVVFSSYAMQIVMAFLMLTMIFVILPRAQVSAKRINEILDTDLTINDGFLTEKDAVTEGVVEFKNVSFKYPDAEEYVIEDISFKANKGDTVAFIGSTGSGKSTLINLIPRFYDVTSGQVLVNGIDVREYKQFDLHNFMGYIPQTAVLFSGTIRENIAYGNDGKGEPSIETINTALEIAQGKQFVDSLDDGLESAVAQGGTNFSGGQKQRLAIARAIARTPQMLIFDDSFSALDYKTDKKLRAALHEQTADVTKFIVAQRIGTIQDADLIVVLEDGKIVGKGKHDELLNSCEVYKEIAYSQLSEEELA